MELGSKTCLGLALDRTWDHRAQSRTSPAGPDMPCGESVIFLAQALRKQHRSQFGIAPLPSPASLLLRRKSVAVHPRASLAQSLPLIDSRGLAAFGKHLVMRMSPADAPSGRGF